MSMTGAFPLERSSYYAFWQLEQRAIETHKWFMSEQVGRDVGMDFATWDWVWAGHRQRWVDKLKSDGQYPI